jgi:ATP-binding protein involved in chromosome partitioning
VIAMTDALLSALSAITDPGERRALAELWPHRRLDLKDGVATLVLKPGGENEDVKALRAAIQSALTAAAGGGAGARDR